MKIIKTFLLAVSASAILIGCGGAVAPIVSTPIENIDALPLKAAPLSEAQYKSWGASDLLNDTIPGMSVNKAYSQILKKRKGQKVVVAVIDSGVDIEHEDLKNVIWVNKGETPGNGKDDDKNGYIDDIHGWNFLGDIVGENMEYVRFMKKLGPKFDGKSESSIGAADRAEFALYQKAKAEYETEHQQALANKTQYEQILSNVRPAHAAISKKLGKEDYTKEDLAAIKNPSATEQQHIGGLTQMLNFADTVPEVIKQLDEGVAYFGGRLDTHFNMGADFRKVLKDNPDDINDKILRKWRCRRARS